MVTDVIQAMIINAQSQHQYVKGLLALKYVFTLRVNYVYQEIYVKVIKFARYMEPLILGNVKALTLKYMVLPVHKNNQISVSHHLSFVQ